MSELSSQQDPDDREPESGESRKGLRYWLDVVVKLTVPVGAIAVGIIANNFEEARTAVTIQTQREQSETALRASMFGHLISPIVGEQKLNASRYPERYSLLVEMLALNFHENVEFKPLMEDADRQLASLLDYGESSASAIKARESLRSVARSVIYRQLAMLGEYKSLQCPYSNPPELEFDLAAVDKKVDVIAKQKACQAEEIKLIPAKANIPICVISPDCQHQLNVSFSDLSWENQTATVTVQSYKLDKDGNTKWQSQAYFILSPYDFPFTDNTLIADGNRYAIYIKAVDDPPYGQFTAGLRWFPKDYFPPRERPTDHSRMREKLGLSHGTGK
jgi:hypothetical protein